MTNNRKTNKRTNETTLKLKTQIYIAANKHFLQAIRPFQLAPYWKLSALAKNRIWYTMQLILITEVTFLTNLRSKVADLTNSTYVQTSYT